jgi:hypothetical protein
VIVADVHGLLEILDAVGQEPRGKGPLLDRRALFLDRSPRFVDRPSSLTEEECSRIIV